MSLTTNYAALESRQGNKEPKCHCGKTNRLIPYTGYYLCVWCRTGQKRVSRLITGLTKRLA